MKHLNLLLAAAFLSVSTILPAQGYLKGKILYFDNGISVTERGGSSFDFSLLGGLDTKSSVSLLSVERALEKAAEDPEIAMVFIRPDKMSASLSTCEEIRESLARFRQKGKPVVCYGVSFSNASYYLGSVADRVFMHPGSSGTLNGLSSNLLYYKDLLDTLGVEVQLIRHGSYKSAGEPYIRSEISPENREQYEVLLSSIWNPVVGSIAASRGLEEEKVRQIVDGLELNDSQDWLDHGLVDGLKYRDEMQAYLSHLFGESELSVVKKVSMSDYVKKLKDNGSDKVAVIYAEGEIVRSGSGIAGEKFSSEIARVRADSSVKAVVLRVNSPGGEVVAADMIRREIELLRKHKPVIASYGDYAASGGYLISAGTDRIFVDNSTLTGSIGVFGQSIVYGGALKKLLHINSYSVGTNAHSDLGSGFRPMDEKEVEWYQKSIDNIYDTFVGVVGEGRGMSRESVDSIAQGRVWAGKDALGIGLADETGILMDAVRYAASKAGITKYRIVAYPAKKSFLEDLRSRKASDKSDPIVRVREVLPPGFTMVARLPYIRIEGTGTRKQ